MVADFIQPGLIQLQPNLDDFMDTLEPLQGNEGLIGNQQVIQAISPQLVALSVQVAIFIPLNNIHIVQEAF